MAAVRRIGLPTVAAGVAVLASVVRLAGLTREPFWVDEVITFNLTANPGLADLRSIADGIHPPLYFLGVAQWRALFGSSEFAVRSYSVLWSVIAVVATMLLAREVGRTRTTVVVAGVVAAISPLAVYFGQEARMYAQASALIAIGCWALLAWFRRSAEGSRVWPWAVLYTLSVVALLLTHHIGIVFVAAQGIATLAVCLRRRDFRLCLGYGASVVAAALLFLPWLRYVLSLRASLYRASSLDWIPPPGWRDVLLLFTRDLVWGSPGFQGREWLLPQAVSAVLAVVVLWSVWTGRRPRPDESQTARAAVRGRVFTAWMVVGPVVLAVVVSVLYHPVLWYPRFCVLVLPSAIVLAGAAVESARHRVTGRALAMSMMMVAGVGLLLQHHALTKGGMREFARSWQTLGPPDVTFVYPEWKRSVARYELGGALPANPRWQLRRRLDAGAPFTIWVCSHLNYDSTRRPKREGRERERILSLGTSEVLGVVDRIELVEVRVFGEDVPASEPTS